MRKPLGKKNSILTEMMVWWRQRKEGPSVQGFKDSLGNIVRPCLKQRKNRRGREGGERGREEGGSLFFKYPHQGHSR